MLHHQHKVKIDDVNAAETMDIVRELRSAGLVQGRDFDFKFTPRRGDGWTYHVESSFTEFYFREGKWTTFLALKYAK